MTALPTLNGQIIGQAHLATRALLDRSLAEVGLGFDRWVALNILGRHGAPLPATDLVDRLTDGLKIDEPGAEAVLADLRARELITAEVALTPPGVAVFDQLTAAIAVITARLYGDLPEQDLVIAARILTTVTARATHPNLP